MYINYIQIINVEGGGVGGGGEKRFTEEQIKMLFLLRLSSEIIFILYKVKIHFKPKKQIYFHLSKCQYVIAKAV